MGSITPYTAASGKRYRVRYRKPDRSQTDKRGFRSKRDAELFLATVEVTKASGSFVDPSASRATIGSLAADWLANKRQALKPSSFHSIEVAWRVYVEPRWALTPIGSIVPSAVEQWIRELGNGTAMTYKSGGRTIPTWGAKPRSATVTLRALGILAGILDVAVRDGRIPKNVARGAENLPKKQSRKPRRYLSHAEVVRFAEAANDLTRSTLIVLLSYCGLRWGEAIGLRVRDLNMLRRRLHVNQSATEVDGVIRVGPPKNRKERAVPFPSFLSVPLARLCEGKGADDLVFGDEHGAFQRRPKTSEGTSSWFLTALTTARLERLTPHDLRHTAASLAVSSGANVKAVQRMLGHESAAMTLDTYADLFDDDLDAVSAHLEVGASTANVGNVWANLDGRT